MDSFCRACGNRIRLAQRLGTALTFSSCAILLLVGLKTSSVAGEPTDFTRWNCVEVGSAGQLAIRVRVKPEASLADEHWIAIEFDNRGKDHVSLQMVRYRIESTRFSPRDGELVSSGSLASGNDHDLFPHCWDETPVAPRIVKPGAYRMVTQPSDYSSALLRLPPEEGLVVKSQIFIDLAIVPKGKQSGYGPALTFQKDFEFLWKRPKGEDTPTMKKRLGTLLVTPQNRAHHSYILGTLLDLPNVSSDFRQQQLLRAISLRHGPFDGRNALVKHLDEHHANDALVIDHYRKALAAGDEAILEDLWYAPNVWSHDYEELLVRMFERDPSRYYNQVFSIFERHGPPQASDPILAKRLSAALLQLGRPTILDEDQLSKLSVRERQSIFASLARWITVLGNTRDRDLIPMLKPFLGDKSRAGELKDFAIPFFGSHPPLLRVCDAALQSIERILGRPRPEWPRMSHSSVVAEELFARRPADWHAHRTQSELRLFEDNDRRIEQLRSDL